MEDIWNDLAACLELRSIPTSPTDGAGSSPTGPPHTFEGSNQHLPHRRLFGGQLLGQFVRTANAANPSKAVKSLHASFLREGTSDTPVHYLADLLHDGRSFGALTVTATQGRRPIATCAVSLHAAEAGPSYQPLPPTASLPGPENRVRFDLLPWDTRSVTDLDAPGCGRTDYDLWMRMPTLDDEGSAAALLAYSTDLNVIGTALRPFDGIDQRGNGTAFTSATTSHTVWFHRPFATDDWLLLRHYGATIAHGRCFGRGDVFTADGTLVASFAQEALLRFHVDAVPAR
ncbi:acyl-CoA thioesterase [Nocardia sp. NPDC056541]|uniref:acyl-CoA thioesterase n=1 Tax=Nocardia sp. NPDC056541 TaxID=3345860 RepID=UPI00366E7E3A